VAEVFILKGQQPPLGLWTTDHTIWIWHPANFLAPLLSTSTLPILALIWLCRRSC